MVMPDQQGPRQGVGALFKILEMHPLLLSLVVMNFALIALLFYAAGQRKDAVNMIVTWQQKTDQLMASCVTAEVIAQILNAARPQLPETPLPPPRPQP
jgi:hypothetical protein